MPTRPSIIARLRALEKFVATIASLKKDGEPLDADGNILPESRDAEAVSFYDMTSDDAVDTCASLINKARALVDQGPAITRSARPSGYGPECVVATGGGAQLRASASPLEVDYIRVCDQNGIEVGYWTVDEVKEDPADVLGAIMGCLAGGWNNPDTRNNTVHKLLDALEVRDWRIAEGEGCPRKERTAYQMTVDINSAGQLNVAIAPKGKSKKPGLCAMFEINHGRPEAHVSPDDRGSDNILHLASVPDGFEAIPDSDREPVTRCGPRNSNYLFKGCRP